MKASEFINKLQNLVNKYGDGNIYQLDECGCREEVYVDEKIEDELIWNPDIQDTERVIKKVEYYVI